MPNVNVYLSEEEYVRLAYLAMEKGVKASALARTAIRNFLKEHGPEKKREKVEE